MTKHRVATHTCQGIISKNAAVAKVLSDGSLEKMAKTQPAIQLQPMSEKQMCLADSPTPPFF